MKEIEMTPKIKEKVIEKSEIQHKKNNTEQVKFIDPQRVVKNKVPDKPLQLFKTEEKNQGKQGENKAKLEKEIVSHNEGEGHQKTPMESKMKEAANHENLLDSMDNWYYYHMPTDEELVTNNSEIRENLQDKVEEIITDKQLGVLPDGSTFNMPDDASLDELYMLGSDFGAESYVNYHHSEVKEQAYEDLSFDDLSDDEELDPRYQ